MQYFELSNRQLRVRVCSLGAELQSMYSTERNMEYIWQPGAEIFDHHSLLLFPNAGRIADNRIIVDGKPYPAMMHGFAKDMEFTAAECTPERMVLELTDNEDTRRYFPFAFRFQVVFTLREDTLLQQFIVTNRGSVPLYYCLGAHPGFFCPMTEGESADDYVLSFDVPQNLDRLELEEKSRLLTGRKIPYLVNEREIALNEHFFDRGPLLFENMRAKTITLKSLRSGHFMELGVENFGWLCLWGAPEKMSVICIEPWSGTSDRMDSDHIWEKKPGIRRIEAGRTDTSLLTFRAGKFRYLLNIGIS